jgi:hypothetical protein
MKKKQSVTEKKEFSAKEWKKKYYPISAGHSSLNKETRESLLKAVDHSITKWEGLTTIKAKDIDVRVISPFTAVEELIELQIDSDSCALCMRTGTNCPRCPLYYAQGNLSCGGIELLLNEEVTEEPFGKAMDAEDYSSFIKAAKEMVKNLKKARKIAENPKFPYSIPYSKDLTDITDNEHEYLDSL